MGIRGIKNYLDKKTCMKHYPNWGKLFEGEKKEIRKAMNQASAGLLSRNWMEVRKLFLLCLYDSPSCPYEPVDAMLERDKY